MSAEKHVEHGHGGGGGGGGPGAQFIDKAAGALMGKEVPEETFNASLGQFLPSGNKAKGNKPGKHPETHHPPTAH